MRPAMTNRSRSIRIYYTLLIAPAVCVILLLTLYPVVSVFLNSFQEYNFISGARRFVFWENYLTISGEEPFRQAFGNTVVFSAAAMAVETLLGFLLALLFYKPFRGRLAFSLVLMAPMMVSTMVVSALWRSLFHFDIGLLNSFALQWFGRRIPWLISGDIALFSIVLVDIWQWTPFAFVMMSAALQTIPPNILEAARIDGCGALRTVRHMILPLMLSHLATVAMLRTIDTFRIFGKVYALTGGGPGNATETISYFIYREAFSYFNFGRSGAASMMAFLLIACIALLYIPRIMKGGEA